MYVMQAEGSKFNLQMKGIQVARMGKTLPETLKSCDSPERPKIDQWSNSEQGSFICSSVLYSPQSIASIKCANGVRQQQQYKIQANLSGQPHWSRVTIEAATQEQHTEDPCKIATY